MEMVKGINTMNRDDYFTIGFMDYPAIRFRPRAGTLAEDAYSRGWSAAQRAENCSDNEWEFGRETYAAHYGTK